MKSTSAPTLDDPIIQTTDGLKNQKALTHIAILIDAASDHRSSAGTGRNGIVAPIPVDSWDDDWKR